MASPLRRRSLESWFTDHPRAWEGWPTFMATTWTERAQRLDRLKAHGCPFKPRSASAAAQVAFLDDVDHAIANLRTGYRATYRRRAEQLLDFTPTIVPVRI